MFFDDGTGASSNEINTWVKIEFFLRGDLKFLFQLWGRYGYEKDWCLFCFLKKSEWNKNYLTKNYSILYDTC